MQAQSACPACHFTLARRDRDPRRRAQSNGVPQDAESPGNIAERLLPPLALASLADENAVARTRRSSYRLSFTGPWAPAGQTRSVAIARERIKEGQLPALDEILSERLIRCRAGHAPGRTGAGCTGPR